MKKARMDEIKVGQWLEATCGIYEVTKEYEGFHDWLTVREVVFDDEGDGYTLGEESHITSRDMASYNLI